jgi:hypothetical protein
LYYTCHALNSAFKANSSTLAHTEGEEYFTDGNLDRNLLSFIHKVGHEEYAETGEGELPPSVAPAHPPISEPTLTSDGG